MQLKHVIICLFMLTFSNLQAQYQLRGKVLSTQQEPLANIAVQIPSLELGAVTDEKGAFSFADLPAGGHQLVFSSLGYARFEKIVLLGPDQSSSLEPIVLLPVAYQMGEVQVAATRAKDETPMTFTNLEKEELELDNLGLDAPFLLRWTPSAIVTSDAGAGIGYTGIRIRGTDPTRINVTINGVPLNDSESQGVFWVNMPDFLSSADNLQVQRGVGTSSNGAGAFGATININTAKVREEAYGSINTSIGSFNTFKRNVQFGTGVLNDRFVIDGRLSKINSDGYIDRASSDLTSYYVSAAYLGDRSALRFNAFSGHEITYQAWNGVPADLIEDRDTRTFNSAGLEKSDEPYDNEVDDYTQRHYQLHFNHQISATASGNISLHYTEGFGFFEQYKAEQDLSAYGFPELAAQGIQPDLVRRLWLDNDFYGTVFSLNLNPGKYDFTFGGGYNIYEGLHFGEIVWSELAEGLDPEQAYYDNDARKTDFNIYAKLNYPLSSQLSAYLDVQWRRIGYEFLGFDLNGNNVSQTDDLSFFNPKLGLNYAWDNNTSAYASFAVAQREPNRNDYVESTPASRPRPEQLYDTEIGFKKEGKNAGFEATLYYMYYRDQLALNGQLNDVGAFTRTNIDESYRLGLELVGGWQLASQLTLDGTATVSRNKVVAFEEFIDVYLADGGYEQAIVRHENTDLSFSPSVIASLGLTWSPFREKDWLGPHNFDINLQTKYVGRQYLDNTSDPNNVIDPYSFTNLRLNLNLKNIWLKEVGITFLVQNVFDALYETNGWSYRYRLGQDTFVDQGYYPQATRNYLLGLSFNF